MDTSFETAQNKIILLYALSRSEKSLPANGFMNVILELRLMNYFVYQENLSELMRDGFAEDTVMQGRHFCSATYSGRRIAELFASKVPSGIRKRLKETVVSLEGKEDLEAVVITDCREIDVDVFEAELIIRENATDLLDIRIYAGSKSEAVKLCDNFRKGHEKLYKYITGFLTQTPEE